MNTCFSSNGGTWNNTGTVGDGDLYSVRPEVIKGGHIIDSDSFVRELRVQ
jgi:hypothetical protein